MSLLVEGQLLLPLLLQQPLLLWQLLRLQRLLLLRLLLWLLLLPLLLRLIQRRLLCNEVEVPALLPRCTCHHSLALQLCLQHEQLLGKQLPLPRFLRLVLLGALPRCLCPLSRRLGLYRRCRRHCR